MANVTLSWQLPTTRQQGGPLLESEISTVRVEMSADGGVNYGTLQDIRPTDPQTVTAPDLEFGTWHFRIAVYDQNNQRGEYHVESVDVADDTPPAAVTSVTVTID